MGRGGGSNEDLMAFNDERVVRRLAAVRVPVVSAVGHDVDTTLCDWVADLRAATPSQAAELTVVDSTQRQERLAHQSIVLRRSMARRLADDRATLQTIRSRIGDPRFTLLQCQQQLDEAVLRAAGSIRTKLKTSRSITDAFESRLRARHPMTVVARARTALVPLELRLPSAIRTKLSRLSTRLSDGNSRLSGLSPLAILARGYSIAYRLNGQVVRSSVEIDIDEQLSLRLHEGGATVVVQEKRMPQPNIVDGTWKGPGP